MYFRAKHNKQSAQTFSGLLISQGKRELGEGDWSKDEARIPTATEPSGSQSFPLISGNKVKEKVRILFSFCKWKNSLLLTLTSPPELLPQC